MAFRRFGWVLLAGTALAGVTGVAALAQSAGTGAADAVDCTKDPKNAECVAGEQAKQSGSTYLTPLVVSGANDAGSVGDPYAKPAAVSAVGKDEINQFGGQNLDNVLRATAGTFTRDSPQNPGVAVNIRNFEGSGRVNMEIDGARQTFRFTGHEAQGFTYIDPALLSGIDITRGEQAGPGGSGALAGVAEFRTLEVDDLIQPDKDFGGFASVTTGSNGTGWSEAGAAAFRISDTFAMLGALSFRNPTNYANGNGDTVPFTAQDIKSGLAKLEITPSADQKLTLAGLIYNDDFTANSYDQTVTNQTYTAKYDYTPADNDAIDFHASIYRNKTEMQYGTSPTLSGGGAAQGRNIDDSGWGFRLYNTSRGEIGDVGLVSTYGLEYSADDVDVLNSSVGNTTGVNPSGSGSIGGVFATTTASIGIVDLTGGLRYDRFTANGTSTLNPLSSNPLNLPDEIDVDRNEGRLNPSFNLAVNATDWLQPYVSYAESMRAPTVNELLAGGDHPSAPGTDPGIQIPNPTLLPEIAKTWEVGVNVKRDDLFTAGDSFRLKANYFSSEIENYITSNVIYDFPPFPPYFYYEAFFVNNPGISHVKGVELQAAYDAGSWFGSLAYTHTDTDLPAQDGLGAPSFLPDHIFSATAGVRLLEQQNLTLGGRIYAVSDTSHAESDSTEGYKLVDLFGNYRFDNGVELGANISNLFDVAYTPALSYTPSVSGPTGRGRTFELTLKSTF